MSEMTISTAKAKTRPKYDILAAAVLERCRAFYEDDENERAYQEWKKNEGSMKR